MCDRNHRVHSITLWIVILFTFIMFLLNIRTVHVDGDLKPPAEYGTLQQHLFYRGWPLAPWMLCSFHGGKWHPNEDYIWFSLIIDVIINVIILIGIAFIIEWCVRWRGKTKGNGLN